MKKRAWGWLSVSLVCWCLVGGSPAVWAQEGDYSRLCGDLKKAGFHILESGVAYGVPFIKIKIPQGFSVTSFCRRLPSLSSDFKRCRDKIAFFNALNPSYVKTRGHEPFSIETDSLKIPLDLHKVPEVFPSPDASLAGHEKYLLVDIGKGFLGYYVRGELKRVFPVSAGAAGKQTPLFSFKIEKKLESHWSTIYDTLMPWALLLRQPYYIHGGALPGKDDSAGCIRMLTEDAKELFHLVEVGTPGRIVQTPKLEKIYPASFCR